MSGRLAQGTVAVLGFGHQGEVQALNLRDAGLAVVVGARPGGESERRASAAGFATRDPAGALRGARTVAVLLPDQALPAAWPALAPALAPGAALVFAHGFNLLYGGLAFPGSVDVVLVAPTGPGSALRAAREGGAPLPAYLAVHRDASGVAWEVAEAYAAALGCAPLWRTTVREETEVDLFGEQVVLCGGMNALVTAAFETLVEHGYTPEIAYLECVHQLKYLADLLHARGVAGLRDAISGTALFGDLSRGPRVIGPESRAEMRAILDEIRSGDFARAWAREASGGRRWLDAEVERARGHALEAARRRALAGGSDPAKGD